MAELFGQYSDAFLMLAVLAAGLWFGLLLGRLRTRLRIASHRRQGARAEKRARRLLKTHGYKIEDAQVSGHVHLRVDGASQKFLVRADFIVSKGGMTYVAECKGGSISGSVANIATRRQLLEYSFAFPVDGIILVNAAENRVMNIAFQRSPSN